MSLDKPKTKSNLLKAAAVGLQLMMPTPEAHAQSHDFGPYVETQQEIDMRAFLEKKGAELQSNPKFRDGYKVLREWKNESGLHCMEFLTSAISRSGAWIVKETMCEDPVNKGWAPVDETKLVEIIEQWGPGTFEDDMRERDSHFHK